MKNECLTIKNTENLFFTADLHFGHENIIKLCDRPFDNVNQMDEILIANWNDVIPPDGLVFVLGDMFWHERNQPYYLEIMARLQGKKVLVAGNHDYFTRQQYLDMGFIQAENYLEAWIGKHFVAMFHYPMGEWHRYYRKSWHLHGHCHGRFAPVSPLMLDVGVDAHCFLPWSWQEIGDYFSSLDEKAA